MMTNEQKQDTDRKQALLCLNILLYNRESIDERATVLIDKFTAVRAEATAAANKRAAEIVEKFADCGPAGVNWAELAGRILNLE